MTSFAGKWRAAALLFVCLLLVLSGVNSLRAQGSTGSVQGVITDQKGQAIQGAAIVVANAADVRRTAVSGGDGKWAVTGLTPGTYTVATSATGFGSDVHHNVAVTAGQTAHVAVQLTVASVAEEVTVEAESDNSLAVQTATTKALLDAGSPRTEISSVYINEFTTPVTDFADIIQAAPGTVSYTTNGIGNGQAKIFFRGFVDDDYTMTWDGVPFNDSNDPSHHSWAYVPSPAIGYVDFDRSPGTASDIGPSNFGGSIHFFSPNLPSQPQVRGAVTYGSWNTQQYLGEFNTGLFHLGNKEPKANFWLEGHYQTSDGYQSFSPKQDVAATAKFNYKFSDRTNFTLIGTNVIVDAFTNNDPTRRQYLHHGDRYLYDGTEFNTAYGPTSKYYYDPQYYKFSVYHVPSFFDIASFNHDFGNGWKIDTKSYTYGYSNHQHYQNNTDQDLVTDSLLTKPVNEVVGGDDQPTSSPYYSRKPTGVDKLNQYGRIGEIAGVSYATKWGVFRTGSWYEFTSTNRYQIYSDPITWVDSQFISNVKFHEHFITQAVQPYAEFQLVSIPKWTITAGIKDAYYQMHLKQWADGKTVGPLGCPAGSTVSGCGNFVEHTHGYNSWLPSLEANYRISSVWSAYGQYGRGSIAPFSSVFDATGAQVAVAPPPTTASTYQGGTVVKLNRLAFDADVYHIHFTNTYSSYTPSSGPDTGFTYYYSNPDSNTNGAEAEGTYTLGNGLSFDANGTFGVAKYEAGAAQAATATTPAVAATPAAWVASAPHDTESAGMTYRGYGFDLGAFGKRVGTRWGDISNYHQTVEMDPFWMSNVFLNYTIRNHSLFNNSKIKLSLNNIFDDHSVVAISPANDGTTLASPYTVNPALEVTQSLQPYTPSWNDTLQKQAGRAVMITFQIGLNPREK